MRLAQQLYEGVDIKGNGTVGVIISATDSHVFLRKLMQQRLFAETYGKEYVAEGTKTKSADKDPGCS